MYNESGGGLATAPLKMVTPVLSQRKHLSCHFHDETSFMGHLNTRLLSKAFKLFLSFLGWSSIPTYGRNFNTLQFYLSFGAEI